MTNEGVLRGGIDLGGTKIQAVVVDEDHVVLGQSRHPTPTTGGPQDVADAMVAAMTEAAGLGGVEPDALAGVGVGSPGDVDATRGTVGSALNLPGWADEFALGAALERSLGTRTRLGNDVQVATDAEAELGAGRPFSSLLGVFWGTGVGGGIVLDNRPWIGRGTAGEIGHIVVRIGGERCGCGRRGCMEAYAGRVALERAARAAATAGRPTELLAIQQRLRRPRMSSGVWKAALDAGDPLAHELIDRAVEALAAAIASAVNLVDVEAVLIGGGLGDKLGEPFVRRVETAMIPHLFLTPSQLEVRLGELGDYAGAMGAALLISGDQAGARR
jgi:glucokinase